MSVLESIKSERKLSFSHWRYRILHWTFSVRNPDPKNLPWSTGLPMFLYTHYCPLFHLTNLIAILSPLILLIKFIFLTGRALAACVDLIPTDKIRKFFSRFIPEPKECSEPEKPRITAAMEKRSCIKWICNHQGDFESFWAGVGRRFVVLSKEVVEAIFADYMPKVEAARERNRLRKKKWRERIIFWTNFSRVFIKWAMNLVYIALFALLLYAVYALSGTVWNGICWLGNGIVWLFTDAVSTGFLWFLGKVLLWSSVGIGIIIVITKLGIVQRFTEKLADGLIYISPPFFLLLVPFRWIRDGFKATSEFVSMFYEENCPPIQLVSEEEAVVESLAQGEADEC